MVLMSMPSMTILPPANSANRRKLIPRVDLPLPVLPIRPIFSLALMSNEMPWMTDGSSGSYLTMRSSTWIWTEGSNATSDQPEKPLEEEMRRTKFSEFDEGQ